MEKKVGRPLGLLKGANRNIRLTDAEWSTFRTQMGPEWLRAKIEEVAKHGLSEPIPREQALEQMQAQNCGDPEGDHIRADKVMCEVLTSLGYGELVKAFETIKKWYA